MLNGGERKTFQLGVFLESPGNVVGILLRQTRLDFVRGIIFFCAEKSEFWCKHCETKVQNAKKMTHLLADNYAVGLFRLLSQRPFLVSYCYQIGQFFHNWATF